MKEHLTAILIATIWWIVRNIFANEKDWKQFLSTTIWSWLLWLLAFFIAPYITSEQNIQYSIVYIFWLSAPQIVWLSVKYLPIIIEKYLWLKSSVK